MGGRRVRTVGWPSEGPIVANSSLSRLPRLLPLTLRNVHSQVAKQASHETAVHASCALQLRLKRRRHPHRVRHPGSSRGSLYDLADPCSGFSTEGDIPKSSSDLCFTLSPMPRRQKTSGHVRRAGQGTPKPAHEPLLTPRTEDKSDN